MSITLKTHKLLWGKSGNRCAFPECRHELIADETESDDESIIGDEAHIIARQEDGPRGEADMNEQDRDKYKNLILLCRIHHKIIDDQSSEYTVGKLTEMKTLHEKWVKESLGSESYEDKSDLAYASYIDEIISLFDYQNWHNWTSSLLSHGQPKIGYRKLKELEKIPDFIISRFWPGRFSELESVFFCLKDILNDFLKVFYKYIDEETFARAENSGDDLFVYTERFYRIREWDSVRYNELLEKYEYHVALVQDLVFELTRMANFTCELVRKFITAKFREKEGKLLVISGPNLELSWTTFKVEYSPDQKLEVSPYNGLRIFMTERENRDLHLGTGICSSYFPFGN